MNSITFGSDCEGFLTVQDVLAGWGIIQFRADLPMDGRIFEVRSKDFHFKFWADRGKLTCQRDDTQVSFPEEIASDLAQRSKKAYVQLRWSPQVLSISMSPRRGQCAPWTEGAQTPPTLPPTSLIVWARKQALLPVTKYGSEESLRHKVYCCLDSIQDRTARMTSLNLFWDIAREGNRIVSRSPKAETDVHSFVQGALQDAVLAAGIELVPEHTTGAGNLDFAFLGSVRGRGVCCICLEVKNAHSDGLRSGLETQLPRYMQSMDAAYGAYLVFWYKGKWWPEPRAYSSPAELGSALQDLRLQRTATVPSLERVRTFVVDLSGRNVASAPQKSGDPTWTDPAAYPEGYRAWIL